MSKMPPIPKEQRSFGGARPDLHDAAIGHENRDTNLAERGRSANLRQNLTHQQKSGDR